jgi:16S rRNA (uracil1498-N3)-methyltransferase
MGQRFHVNCELGPGPVEIDGPEGRHLVAVMRVRPGDRVYLFNGDGRQYPAEVEEVSRHAVVVRVLGVESPACERTARLEVATPLPRGDRAAFLIEKLTELGVTAFVPLATMHSVVHPREGKLDRLERQVIEASKQCGRNVLMTVAPLTEWREYCRREDLPALKLLAHPGGDSLPLPDPAADVVLAIGPEGGFHEDEAEQARQAGWRAVGLGPRVLRVETAALALAAWFSIGQSVLPAPRVLP